MSDEVLRKYRQNEREARARAALARDDTSKREWQDIADVWSALIVSWLKRKLQDPSTKAHAEDKTHK
jgi:hypothetical protein